MVLEAGKEPKIDWAVGCGEVGLRGEQFTDGSRAINAHGFAIE
jgi:hypothetical protein